jgi:uncharacterized YccA/Bax inhibitor family protein
MEDQMKSSNPVFVNSDTFNGQADYGYQTYPANGPYSGYGQLGYRDPATWQVGTPTIPGRMTIDSTVQKTAVTLGLVVAAAAATWVALPDNLLGMAWIGGAILGLLVGLVISFSRNVSPALVMIYALAEGAFIGAASKAFEAAYPGVVVGAVLGTVAATAGTLAAYKFFNIAVTDRFRKYVTAAIFGFVAVSLLDFVLQLFGSSFGFNGLGAMGLVSSLVGLGLGILMLILDFDYIERAVAAGAPERESWRAAFGLTVTIVWIYIELLRILAIFRN